MRLAKVKPIPKAFAKVMDDGTDKTVDTALWLAWRMTLDDDFCQRVFRNNDLVSTSKDVLCVRDCVCLDYLHGR